MASLRWSTSSLLATLVGGVAVGLVVSHWLRVPPNPASGKEAPPSLSQPGAKPDGTVVVREPATVSAPDASLWLALRSAPGSQSSDERLVLAMEALAEANPDAALKLAAKEKKVRLRWELHRALARGWARRNPEEATTWALRQQAIEVPVAVDAVLASLVKDPTAAVAMARRAAQEAPEHAAPIGNALLSLLAKEGAFAPALAFARGAPEAVRADWMAMTYQIWSGHRPDEALAALETEADAATRARLRQSVIEGWAQADPSALAAYAVQALEGPDRSRALVEAVRAWATVDVVAAARWVGSLDPSADVDSALVTMATTPQALVQPLTALEWAQSIRNPEQRTSTLMEIMREWSVRAPKAAWEHARTLEGLSAADRTSLVEYLGRSVRPTG